MTPKDSCTTRCFKFCGFTFPNERFTSGSQSTHGLTSDAYLLFAFKNAAQGTDEFAAASATCSATLFVEYLRCIERTKDNVRMKKHGSKGWWRVADRIMGKQGARMSFQLSKTQMPFGCVIRWKKRTYLRGRFPANSGCQIWR